MTKMKWICAYFSSVLCLGTWLTIDSIKESQNLDIVSFLLVYLIFILVAFTITLPIFFAIIFGIKNLKNLKGYDDFEQNIPFYRDIIDNYSISAIAADYDLFIDLKKQIVLILMDLNRQNKISLNNDGIQVIDSNTEDLDKVSAYILSNIENGYVVLFGGDNTFEPAKVSNFMRDEALKSGLVVSKLGMTQSIKWGVLCLIEIILCIICYFWFIKAVGGDGIWMFAMLIFKWFFICAPFIFPLAVLIYFLVQMISTTKYIFVRSSTGNNIMTKLFGLKNFMREFTVMDEKKLDELKFWDYYLIYSVLFGINNQIFNEYYQFIKLESIIVDFTKLK